MRHPVLIELLLLEQNSNQLKLIGLCLIIRTTGNTDTKTISLKNEVFLRLTATAPPLMGRNLQTFRGFFICFQKLKNYETFFFALDYMNLEAHTRTGV